MGGNRTYSDPEAEVYSRTAPILQLDYRAITIYVTYAQDADGSIAVVPTTQDLETPFINMARIAAPTDTGVHG